MYFAHIHTQCTPLPHPPPCILPGVLELDEGERRAAPVLQIDERHLAELVEQILDVLGADVRRQIANVDATLVAAAVRHRLNLECVWVWGEGAPVLISSREVGGKCERVYNAFVVGRCMDCCAHTETERRDAVSA